ncbi:hypothetical protein [Lysobacter enzymogenes]|uniref:hypothetical protein n=1 Tax=Lysobacter enzymogenes TaxID=69 RepID=UPI001A9749FB|nr:hypothetical protein [Lysobacter enzymogenes]QQP94967.1 hypothetical protein JHW38_17180 [Lysobacter enzymogenes]
MSKGSSPLAAAALCLLGLSAFAHDAAAAQWVETGRTAYYKTSFFGSYDEHTCNAGGPTLPGYSASCANDAASGWTANFDAANGLANDVLMTCNHNPFQAGSACDGSAYAIDGQAVAGGLPAACGNVGARAVASWTRVETVVIQFEELDMDTLWQAREYVCQ